MKEKKLTEKQCKFCDFYAETGNASEAYRRAYNCGGMKPGTVRKLASQLLASSLVSERVEALRSDLRAKAEVTREEIARLCADVLRGKEVTDFSESRPDGKRTRTVSKTWAAERLCKMLGFDAPARTEAEARVEVSQPGAAGIDLSALPDEVVFALAGAIRRQGGGSGDEV